MKQSYRNLMEKEVYNENFEYIYILGRVGKALFISITSINYCYWY